MHLITYWQGSTTAAGLLLKDQVVDLGQLLAPAGRGRLASIATVEELLTRYPLEHVAEAAADFPANHGGPQPPSLVKPVTELQVLPPVLRPSKVIGVGMNYRTFVQQIGASAPTYPELFHKTSSALCGHGQPVVIPPITDQAVPEGELAVIMGRRAHAVTPAQARARIAGYTVANDISARNLEFRTTQWTSGKMLATFCPLGPALVTADEIPDVQNLQLTTSLNGRIIQQGNTSGMILGVYDLISEVSHLVSLEVGDVVLTGTPSDLGETDPPVFLRAADSVRVEIAGLGTLQNPVEAPHLADRPTTPSPT